MSEGEFKKEWEDTDKTEAGRSVFSNVKAGTVEVDSQSTCDSKKDTESESNGNASSNHFSLSSHVLSDEDTAETFFCQICYENNNLSVAFTLPCQHQFCQECILSYVKSKVTDGRVYPTCFFIDEKAKTDEGEDALDPAVNERALQKYKACGAEIPSYVVETLLANDKLLAKYMRYKFVKENANARECPYCSTWNITLPEKLALPEGSRVHCENTQCQRVYCYYHANAHDFDVYPTCAEYEAAIAPQMKANEDFLSASSKPCPGCHIHVMKSGGCNHMKCQCGVAFCWLCGKQIDDSLFPAHFQWWNPSGCSNLQMNESIEPTTCARICARGLSILQLIVLGPLTLISTLTSSLLCCSCIVLKLQMQQPLTFTYLQTFFGNCMSSWGIFWMFVLCFLPLALVGGTVFVTAVFVGVVITYPCYATHRMRQNQYPWPDGLTMWMHHRIVCFTRCWHCLCGGRADHSLPNHLGGGVGSTEVQADSNPDYSHYTGIYEVDEPLAGGEPAPLDLCDIEQGGGGDREAEKEVVKAAPQGCVGSDHPTAKANSSSGVSYAPVIDSEPTPSNNTIDRSLSDSHSLV